MLHVRGIALIVREKERDINLLMGLLLLTGVLLGQPNTQDDCANAFADAEQFTAGVFERMAVDEDGVITWDSTDWENIVRRVVGTSEYYLNNCVDPELPLAEQAEALEQLAALSQIAPPVESVDVGGDFGDVALVSDFTPTTEFLDLNGDGADELILHTQVPYFSDATVYQLRGGLSVAFFQSEDGWQGQVIAPVTNFVTDESGEHISFAMLDDNTLSVEESHEALRYLPGPEVEVIEPEDGPPLTTVTLIAPTGTGEAKELNILTWDGRIPSVELRVAFDDWCYPGQTLEWGIRDDGSVYVPSNEGEEGSPLHCGRTPEALFEWADGAYTEAEQE